MNGYSWNWTALAATAPGSDQPFWLWMLEGLGYTAVAAALSFALACLLGLACALLRQSGARAARVLGWAWVNLWRSIPVLVQVFFWYFVAPDLLWPAAASWWKAQAAGPFVATLLGVALYMSARIGEQLRAALQHADASFGQAARALGLLPQQIRIGLLLPCALRLLLPSLTSEAVSCVKNTSVGFAVGYAELMFRAKSAQEFSFAAFEVLAWAALLYLALNLALIALAQRLERRWALPGQALERSSDPALP